MEKRKLIISPSILGVSFVDLPEIIRSLESVSDDKVGWIHFDVMDNHFVPNLTFGHKMVKDMRKISKKVFDVHLMITEPEKVVDLYLDAGADLFVFHIEATNKADEIIKKVHGSNKKVGISVKPGTPAQELLPYIDRIDLALVMSVEPGFGGQSFIPHTKDKILYLRDYREKNNLNYIIQADGGIKKDNLAELYALGLDSAVIGSGFFKYPTVNEAAEIFQKVIMQD